MPESYTTDHFMAPSRREIKTQSNKLDHTFKKLSAQASKYLKIGTCPASQKLLLYNAQVTHSRTGCWISHGYNPASFVAIRIGP